eukprot:6099931-Prorocentrum_lima.AAC.1
MMNSKTIVGDQYFNEPKLRQRYALHGIPFLDWGPMTSWPNRAEAAVKLFNTYKQMEPNLKYVA